MILEIVHVDFPFLPSPVWHSIWVFIVELDWLNFSLQISLLYQKEFMANIRKK